MSASEINMLVVSVESDLLPIARMGEATQYLLPRSGQLELRGEGAKLSLETNEPESWRIGDVVRVRIERSPRADVPAPRCNKSLGLTGRKLCTLPKGHTGPHKPGAS